MTGLSGGLLRRDDKLSVVSAGDEHGAGEVCVKRSRGLRIDAKRAFGKSTAFVRISAHESSAGAKHGQHIGVIGCQGQHQVVFLCGSPEIAVDAAEIALVEMRHWIARVVAQRLFRCIFAIA